jgi:folate-binding Fe-S cluster repair protein YgfZ
MLNPQLVLAMAEYLKASEALADATDDLIKAHAARRAGMMCNTVQCEEVALIRLKVYRQARRNWENLQ